MTVTNLHDFSMTNLSGRYRANKHLSTNVEPVWRLQLVPWWIRKLLVKAPAAASSMTFLHYWTEDGKEHIDSLQEMAGVPFANHRIDKVADDESVITELYDPLSGPTKLSCWWGTLDSVTDENSFLREAWVGIDEKEKLLFATYEALDYGWSVLEVTTVQHLDGQKRLVTYSVVTATIPEREVVHSRVVYDPIPDKHKQHPHKHRS